MAGIAPLPVSQTNSFGDLPVQSPQTATPTSVANPFGDLPSSPNPISANAVTTPSVSGQVQSPIAPKTAPTLDELLKSNTPLVQKRQLIDAQSGFNPEEKQQAALEIAHQALDQYKNDPKSLDEGTYTYLTRPYYQQSNTKRVGDIIEGLTPENIAKGGHEFFLDLAKNIAQFGQGEISQPIETTGATIAGIGKGVADLGEIGIRGVKDLTTAAVTGAANLAGEDLSEEEARSTYRYNQGRNAIESPVNEALGKLGNEGAVNLGKTIGGFVAPIGGATAGLDEAAGKIASGISKTAGKVASASEGALGASVNLTGKAISAIGALQNKYPILKGLAAYGTIGKSLLANETVGQGLQDFGNFLKKASGPEGIQGIVDSANELHPVLKGELEKIVNDNDLGKFIGKGEDVTTADFSKFQPRNATQANDLAAIQGYQDSLRQVDFVRKAGQKYVDSAIPGLVDSAKSTADSILQAGVKAGAGAVIGGTIGAVAAPEGSKKEALSQGAAFGGLLGGLDGFVKAGDVRRDIAYNKNNDYRPSYEGGPNDPAGPNGGGTPKTDLDISHEQNLQNLPKDVSEFVNAANNTLGKNGQIRVVSPDLFEANVPDGGAKALGYYKDGTGNILIRGDVDPNSIKTTLVHEVGHVVQDLANPGVLRSLYKQVDKVEPSKLAEARTRYDERIAKSWTGEGEPPKLDDNQFKSEYIAEHLGNILQGRPLTDLTVTPGLEERAVSGIKKGFSNVVSNVFSKLGIPHVQNSSYALQFPISEPISTQLQKETKNIVDNRDKGTIAQERFNIVPKNEEQLSPQKIRENKELTDLVDQNLRSQNEEPISLSPLEVETLLTKKTAQTPDFDVIGLLEEATRIKTLGGNIEDVVKPISRISTEKPELQTTPIQSQNLRTTRIDDKGNVIHENAATGEVTIERPKPVVTPPEKNPLKVPELQKPATPAPTVNDSFIPTVKNIKQQAFDLIKEANEKKFTAAQIKAAINAAGDKLDLKHTLGDISNKADLNDIIKEASKNLENSEVKSGTKTPKSKGKVQVVLPEIKSVEQDVIDNTPTSNMRVKSPDEIQNLQSGEGTSEVTKGKEVKDENLNDNYTLEQLNPKYLHDKGYVSATDGRVKAVKSKDNPNKTSEEQRPRYYLKGDSLVHGQGDPVQDSIYREATKDMSKSDKKEFDDHLEHISDAIKNSKSLNIEYKSASDPLQVPLDITDTSTDHIPLGIERTEAQKKADSLEKQGIDTMRQKTFDKNLIPTGFEVVNRNETITRPKKVGTGTTTETKPIGKDVNLNGFSIDKFIGNAKLALEWAKETGSKLLPYDSIEPIKTDVLKYLENHANGYRGDGKPFVINDKGGTAPTHGEPHDLSPEQVDFLNALMNIKVENYTDLAAFNDKFPELDLQEKKLDVNPLRRELEEEGFYGYDAKGNKVEGIDKVLSPVTEQIKLNRIHRIKETGGLNVKPVSYSRAASGFLPDNVGQPSTAPKTELVADRVQRLNQIIPQEKKKKPLEDLKL